MKPRQVSVKKHKNIALVSVHPAAAMMRGYCSDTGSVRFGRLVRGHINGMRVLYNVNVRIKICEEFSVQRVQYIKA